jgi:hypothetical protein
MERCQCSVRIAASLLPDIKAAPSSPYRRRALLVVDIAPIR